MMKVLFLLANINLPSSRVRVLNNLELLSSKGIDFDILEYPKCFAGKFALFKKISNYDIVFLQKKMPNTWDRVLLRRKAAKLIFDFDDAIYIRDDKSENQQSWKRKKSFNAIVSCSDVVISGNYYLKEKALELNKSTVVLPSAVECKNVPVKDYGRKNSLPVIGWVGTSGNFRHLMSLEKQLRRLNDAIEYELHVVSDKPLSLEGVNVKNTIWSAETQNAIISTFDIGIMPLPDNEWTRGKCGYKALQYMAAAVTPVVSDVGANAEMITNGKNGFKCSSYEDFYQCMLELLERDELRERLGVAARVTIKNRYSVEKISDDLESILFSVFREKN